MKIQGQVFVTWGVKYYISGVKYSKMGGVKYYFSRVKYSKMGGQVSTSISLVFLTSPGIQILGVKYRSRGGDQVFGILDLLCPTDDRMEAVANRSKNNVVDLTADQQENSDDDIKNFGKLKFSALATSAAGTKKQTVQQSSTPVSVSKINISDLKVGSLLSGKPVI